MLCCRALNAIYLSVDQKSHKIERDHQDMTIAVYWGVKQYQIKTKSIQLPHAHVLYLVRLIYANYWYYEVRVDNKGVLRVSRAFSLKLK